MLTADQRKELEALEAEMRTLHWKSLYDQSRIAKLFADRIAAVLANGVEE